MKRTVKDLFKYANKTYDKWITDYSPLEITTILAEIQHIHIITSTVYAIEKGDKKNESR